MLQFLNNIQQHTLRRFPDVWNTRLISMLLLGLLIHLVFFALGFVSIQSNTILQSYYLSDGRLLGESGIIIISVVISIVVIVLWLIALFRNNAFKHFYPNHTSKLYKTFLYYGLIFLLHISYFASYSLGYKTYINSTYSDKRVTDYYDQANRVSAFLPFEPSNYTIDNKRYPAPFDSIYTETNFSNINEKAPYVQYGKRFYQFYKIKAIHTKSRDSVYNLNSNNIINERFQDDGSVIFYIKDEIVDLKHLVDSNLTLYNFSKPYYSLSKNYYDYSSANILIGNDTSKAYIVWLHDVLKNNDKASVSNTMDEFIDLLKHFDIVHNLNTKDWLNLVWHPTNFIIDSFITNGREADIFNAEQATLVGDIDSSRIVAYDDLDAETKANVDASIKAADEAVAEAKANAAVAEAVVAAVEATVDSNYYSLNQQEHILRRYSRFYVDAEALKNCLDNIQTLKDWNALTNIWKVLLWFAFGLATCLYLVRTTSVKCFILSIVSAGIITLGIVLSILILSGFGSGSNGDGILILIDIKLAILMLLPFVLPKTISKLLRGISINLGLIGIVLFALFILLTIENFERAHHYAKYPTYDYTYVSFMNAYADLIYWGLLLFGMLYTYIYTRKIIHWKGSPEG
jgi:hypothetical protein